MVRDRTPRWNHEHVVLSPLEIRAADIAGARAFNDAIYCRVGRAIESAAESGRQQLQKRAYCRHGIPAACRIRVLHLYSMTVVDRPVAIQPVQFLPAARIRIIE